MLRQSGKMKTTTLLFDTLCGSLSAKPKRIRVPNWVPRNLHEKLLGLAHVTFFGRRYYVPITTSSFIMFKSFFPAAVQGALKIDMRHVQKKPYVDDALRDIVQALQEQTSVMTSSDLTEDLMRKMTGFLETTFRQKLYGHVSKRVRDHILKPGIPSRRPPALKSGAPPPIIAISETVAGEILQNPDHSQVEPIPDDSK